MKADLFNELTESLGQAIEHANGERKDLRITVLPRSPQAVTKKMFRGEKRPTRPNRPNR